VAGRRHAGAGQKVGVAVDAGAGVRGPPLRVEAVVGGLGELAVGDDGLAEVQVQRVHEALPRVLAMELAPPLGDAGGDASISRGCHGCAAQGRTYTVH